MRRIVLPRTKNLPVRPNITCTPSRSTRQGTSHYPPFPSCLSSSYIPNLTCEFLPPIPSLPLINVPLHPLPLPSFLYTINTLFHIPNPTCKFLLPIPSFHFIYQSTSTSPPLPSHLPFAPMSHTLPYLYKLPSLPSMSSSKPLPFHLYLPFAPFIIPYLTYASLPFHPFRSLSFPYPLPNLPISSPFPPSLPTLLSLPLKPNPSFPPPYPLSPPPWNLTHITAIFHFYSSPHHRLDIFSVRGMDGSDRPRDLPR